MTEPLTMTDASEAEADELGERLSRWNQETVGQEQVRRIFLALRDDEGGMRGGMVAFTSWNVLVVDTVWLDPELRGKGHGRRLLEETEDRARAYGSDRAMLETFSWQAEGFYARVGYVAFGRMKDHPTGQSRTHMAKVL